jgi:hypothetical protein
MNDQKAPASTAGGGKSESIYELYRIKKPRFTSQLAARVREMAEAFMERHPDEANQVYSREGRTRIQRTKALLRYLDDYEKWQEVRVRRAQFNRASREEYALTGASLEPADIEL